MRLGKRGEEEAGTVLPRGAFPLLLGDGLGEGETVLERELLRPLHILALFSFVWQLTCSIAP